MTRPPLPTPRPPAPSPDSGELERRNREAWDTLYREAPQSLWGGDPLPFLEPLRAELAVPLGPASWVLDAACGEGRNLPLLATLGARLAGCDSSFSALRRARAAAGPLAQLLACDLARLPFADAALELVVATDVLETLPAPLPGLAELHRVLRPGGVLVCNIPGPDDYIASEQMTPIGEGRFLYRGRYYYQFHGPAEARELLAAAGFANARNLTVEWVEPPHPGFRDLPHRHRSRVFVARRG